jgi:ribonuclease VapC
VPLPVLDASALLAYLRDEPGADAVADAISGGATMSAVNLAEVLTTAADRGAEPDGLLDELTVRGLLDGAISLEPFTTEDARTVARLRGATRAAGLSLGDRACLALAQRLKAPVLTADRTWSELDLDLELRRIR